MAAQAGNVRTVYAYLLARRGEKARASVLLEDALNHARQALAEKNESQRIPIEIAAIHTTRQERTPRWNGSTAVTTPVIATTRPLAVIPCSNRSATNQNSSTSASG